jgi:apolipoprotein N-acyltransferase
MKGGVMKVAAAVVSGLLVAGLFVPFHFSALVWVALVPLLWALWSVRGKRAGWKGFGIGYVGGAVSCVIQFHWLETVSWLGAVLLALYLAIYWGLFGAFAAKFRPLLSRPGAVLKTAFCHGAVWAGLELLRGWLFTGFSWNPLGVAFHEMRTMAQGADLLGVGGLSLVLVFLQAVLVQSFGKWKENRIPLGVAALLVIALFGYGKARIAIEEQAESIKLKTLLVQLNIPQEAARMLWTDLETHQGYEEETLKALDALKSPDGKFSEKWPDWVMWPEIALTGRILFTDAGDRGFAQINHDTLSQVRAAGPFTLIYGAGELEGEHDGEYLAPKLKGRAYNSMTRCKLTANITWSFSAKPFRLWNRSHC